MSSKSELLSLMVSVLPFLHLKPGVQLTAGGRWALEIETLEPSEIGE